jgi:hypothetical protein
VGCLALAPAEHEDGVEDVAGGEVVARELGHSRSLTLIERIEGADLNEGAKSAILRLQACRFWFSPKSVENWIDGSGIGRC